MATNVASGRGAQELSNTLREIAGLAAADLSEDAFFSRFLNGCVAFTNARGASIWLLSEDGLLSQAHRCAEAEQPTDESDQRLHAQQLLHVIGTRETLIRPVAGGPRDGAEHCQVFTPLLKENGCEGVLELVCERSGNGDDAETTAFLEEAAAHAVRFLTWKREAASHARQVEFWRQFQPFALSLQQSLDVTTLANVIVNDGRPLIGCDRLTVVLEHGPEFRLAAASGQEQVDRRSQLAREMCRVGRLAAESNQEILFAGDVDDLPESLAEPLVQFAQVTGARAVKVIPLSEPAEKTNEAEPYRPGERAEKRPAFGALIVEHFTDAWIDPLTSQKADLTAAHAAAALANARVHSRIFLRSLWEAVGRRREWLRGRRLRQVKLVLGCLLAVVVLFAFVPATYRVEGTGLMMPAGQQRVFAPCDGEVVEIAVESGQRVEAGTVLLRMRNEELDADLLAARNRLEELRQRAAALEAEADRGAQRANDEAAVRLRGRLAQTEIEVQGASELVVALQGQVERLTVRAPVAGTVATFDVGQRLKHRPVRRGDLLLELMDENGPWQLELEVPEDRAGHLHAALAEDSEMDLEFVLDTQPEATWTARVREVSRRADQSEVYGSSVRVLAELASEDVPRLHIGAGARAKLDCGTRSLGYVLFGDVVEFVRQRVW